MRTITEHTGVWAIGFINHMLNLFAFTYRLIEMCLFRPLEGRSLGRKTIVEQVYFTAVQALPIIIPISLMMGTTLIIQLSRFSDDLDLEKAIVILLIRELGPVVTALIVILRSATAVTIEISCMVVLKEIESIEMAGADPMRILSLPRFVGITTAVFCMFIIFDILAIFGGYAIVWLSTDLNISAFLLLIGRSITATDLVVGMLKAVSFGITITVISLYHGFQEKSAFTQIPASTSKSAIECFFWCMVINIFISAVFYL